MKKPPVKKVCFAELHLSDSNHLRKPLLYLMTGDDEGHFSQPWKPFIHEGGGFTFYSKPDATRESIDKTIKELQLFLIEHDDHVKSIYIKK